MTYHPPERLPKPFRRLARTIGTAIGVNDGLGEADDAQENWATFLALARFHRVEGLALRGLDHRDACAPQWVIDDLARDRARIAAQALMAIEISSRLLDAFEKASLDILFVKGLSVSKLAYGDPYIKASSDIDILVEPGAVVDAGAALERLGYRCVAPRRVDLKRWHSVWKESIFVRPGWPVVELHSRLTDHPALLAGIGMQSPRQSVAIKGALALPTLESNALLDYLAAHGASSLWFRLKWLADFTALAFNRTDAHPSPASIPVRDTAACLADRVFGTTLGDEGRLRLSDRWFVRLAERQLASGAEPTEHAFGTVPMRIAQLLCGRGARFAASECTRQLRAVLMRP